jgi:hypothetical protein
MLVHFPRNLIYLKTWKTGGTSVEAMLQEALWGSEVQHDQGWKIRWNGFVTPRARVKSQLSARHKIIVSLSPNYPMSLKSNIKNLRNHSSPSEIRNSIGNNIFSSAQKIVCIRNPFSLMVSSHFFRASKQGLDKNDVDNEKAFTAFVQKRLDSMEWQQHLPDLMDSSWRFIRQEHLEDDFRRLASELGLEFKRPLHFKSGLRPPEKNSYEYLYSKYTKDMVATRYRKWIDAFDYRF